MQGIEHRAVAATATARPMGSRTRPTHQSEQQAAGPKHAGDADVVDGLRRGCSATRPFVKGNPSLRPKHKRQAAANTSEREREKGSFRGQSVWVTQFLGRRPLK